MALLILTTQLRLLALPDATFSGRIALDNVTGQLYADLPGTGWVAIGGGGGGGAVTSVFGRTGAVIAVAGDYTAAFVTNVPAGTIAAITVQGAINELDGDVQGKQPLDADLTALAALASTGFIVRTGAGTVAARTIAGGTGISVSNGDGVGGNPMISTTAILATIVDAKGDLIAATAADTVTRLPVGTDGQVLSADSGEATGLRWIPAGSGGAVSSVFGRTGGVVAVSGDYTAGLVANVPAGTIAATDVQGAINELDGDVSGKQPLDADLTALAGIATTGLLARTGAGTAAARTISGASGGLGIANGDGVAGNPTLTLDADLDALAGVATAGLLVRTGAGTAAARTLASTSAGLVVTNGDGVAGAPSLALDADLDAIAAVATAGLLARTGGGTAAARTLASTSAALVVTNGDGVAGAPSLALDADLDAVAAVSSNGLLARTGAGTAAARSVAVGGTTGLTVANGDGVAGNPTISLSATNDSNGKLAVSKNSGATVGTRRRLNLIEGSNVTLTVADDSGNEEVDVTIAASGGGAGGPSLVAKIADETIISDATLSDDSVLKFSMLASTKYWIRLVAYFNTSAAADFKFRVAGPASPTAVNLNYYFAVPNAGPGATININAYPAADITVLSGASAEGVVVVEGVVQNGANAGDFVFQWAQNTSNATNTIVRGSSYMQYAVVP